MKKTETIALYRDAFLEGKDEETRMAFDSKSVEKQYASIIAWRRRQAGGNSEAKNEPSVASILALLKKARKDIPILATLSDRDREKLFAAINEINDDIVNFDRIKKTQLLHQLEQERERIYQQGQDIDRQINSIREEIG